MIKTVSDEHPIAVAHHAFMSGVDMPIVFGESVVAYFGFGILQHRGQAHTLKAGPFL